MIPFIGDYIVPGFTPEECAELADMVEAALPPELPPEVWQTKPADPERCEAATRALCR